MSDLVPNTDRDGNAVGLAWPDAYEALRPIVHKEWGIEGDIYLNRQLSGGKSGALVYTADLASSTYTGQAILKFDTVEDGDLPEEKEFERHKKAIDAEPEYAAQHIERLVFASNHANKVALVSTIAGRGVEYVRPWSSCSFDVQFEAVGELSSGLLEYWNKSYTLSAGLRSPQRLLQDWLQHRIQPGTSRLFHLIEQECGLGVDEPTFTFDGKWYPNPVAFAVGSQPVPDRANIRAVMGNCHYDLHGLNVLVSARPETDLTYSLIDLAMYEPDQCLFFDHAYFEVAHLLNVRGGSGPVYWTTILEHLMEHHPTGLRRDLNADDLGIVHLIGSLRGEMFAWVDRHEPNRLSYMESQYLLARVAAGLNFANKRLDLEPRRLALLYAAFSLKCYLRHQGLDWPKYGPPLSTDQTASTSPSEVETQRQQPDASPTMTATAAGRPEPPHGADTGSIGSERGNGGAMEMPPPLPEHPAIAVLPFENLSDDHEQQFIADGIALDITTELSRVDWLTVIARGSSPLYGGRSVDPTKVGRELGVHYVVDGSIRKIGSRLRVTAQLLDASDGRDIWANRYDGDTEDIYALLDEITESVVANIDTYVKKHQRTLARRKRSPYNAWETFQRATYLFTKLTKKDSETAIQLLHKTLSIDSAFAPALAVLALTEVRKLTFDSEEPATDVLDRALGYAQQAVDSDEDNSLAHSVLGRVYSLIGEHEKALVEGHEAIELNPSSALAYLQLCFSLVLAGRPEEALRAVEKSIHLSPKDPFIWMKVCGLGFCHYLLGDLDEAETQLRRAENGRLVAPFSLVFLSFVLARQDRLEEAREAIHKAQTLRPTMTWDLLRSNFGLKTAVNLTIMETDARKAGFLEPEASPAT